MRTLFSAVTGQRNGSCMTTATCPHRSSVAIRAVSRPSHVTLPEVGRYSPVTSFASVVLPEPFSPTSATTCPRRRVSDTPRRASCS